MDDSVRKRLENIVSSLENEEAHIAMSDPVAKMMLAAMAFQEDELARKMDTSIERLAERFACEILASRPYRPQPAISLLKICNGKESSSFTIDEKATFTYKEAKCVFRSLLPSLIVPGYVISVYAGGALHFPGMAPVSHSIGDELHKGEIWIAYDPLGEVDSFDGVMFVANHPLVGTHERIEVEVGRSHYALELVVEEQERLLCDNYMLADYWRQYIVNHRVWLYRFDCADKQTPIVNSDMPGWLYDMFPPEVLAPLTAKRLLWIKIKGLKRTKLPADYRIEFNCVPVANYDISFTRLSYTEPIRQLDHPKDGAQFLELVSDPQQSADYFVRDFDVEQYDNTRIENDILNLYRHYVNDYYAFVDNNSLNDGMTLRNLREAMTQIADTVSATEDGGKNYSGTYLIRHPRNNNQPVMVSYLTTQGARGNLLKAGMQLASSVAACGEVFALIDAVGGRNKITGPVGKRELAQYSALSNDRIFTEMDIMKFCRVELYSAFGDEVMRFTTVRLSGKSIPVGNHIERCHVVEFHFTSERLYTAAEELNFADYIRVSIRQRSMIRNIEVTLLLD